MRFSVGVNYWPRRTALAMWWRFDASEIGDELARIAALGLDTVRVFALWDEFQPTADAADPAMLDRLATLADLAAGAGLTVLPVLFCGRLAGEDHLPVWARSARGVRDLYTGPMMEAQRVLARAAGERLRGHPALRMWDIGHAFTTLSQPSRARARTGDHSPQLLSESTVAQWSMGLVDELRSSSGIGATAGAYAGDLTGDRGVRFGSLCAPFAFASIEARGTDLGFARNRLDAEAVPFIAMLTATFAHQPVMVSAFGHVTCRPDTFSADYPCLTEDENARYCGEVLERLHADGRLGALWWCWADAAEDTAVAAADRACGIVRADGTEKPVAHALAAFARERREVTRADDMPAISADYYYRTLPSSTETLYQAYRAFVDARRERSGS